MILSHLFDFVGSFARPPAVSLLDVGQMSDSSGNDTPVLLLPAEITAKIFRHCLPAPTTVKSDPHKYPAWSSRYQAPLLLAQICRQWRNVCLDTSELWTSIAFKEKGHPELVDLWLSRARNRSLTIFLRGPRARRLMPAILRYHSQWQDVCLDLPYRVLPLLSMTAFPRLERLALSWALNNETEAFGPATPRLLLIIRNAPLLRYANLNHVPNANLPFEQLTTLHFHYSPDILHTVAILQRSPNLLDLYWLDTGGDLPVTTPPPAPVKLALLRSLKIGDPRLLSLLTAPRLQRLEMVRKIHKVIDGAAANALARLLRRSSCDLQFLVLSLQGKRTSAAALERFLRAAGPVPHLTLDQATIDIQMPALEGVDVLPGLKHLEIRDHVLQESYDHSRRSLPSLRDHYRALLKTLWWRQRNGTLESFELFLCTAPEAPLPVLPAELIAEFLALAEAGLRVRVAHDHDRGVVLDTHLAQ
ncbi:hypothetical protein B0H14DRAFT_3615948 [Mycena olivaceomarginata]|nr:hypothetical protein B0H14DRAFT_3615948 [Mycena olivaceomarginata]